MARDAVDVVIVALSCPCIRSYISISSILLYNTSNILHVAGVTLFLLRSHSCVGAKPSSALFRASGTPRVAMGLLGTTPSERERHVADSHIAH